VRGDAFRAMRHGAESCMGDVYNGVVQR
jgi:hypothetical protein